MIIEPIKEINAASETPLYPNQENIVFVNACGNIDVYHYLKAKGFNVKNIFETRILPYGSDVIDCIESMDGSTLASLNGNVTALIPYVNAYQKDKDKDYGVGRLAA